MQLTDSQSRCTGHFRLVPFGTELHTTCKDCQRRLQKPSDVVVRWSSFAVDKSGHCDQKIKE